MCIYQRKFIAIVLFAATVSAQSGGNFEVSQPVFTNGGEKSNGGNLDLTGTVGQPSSGVNSSGGRFALRGGFWQALFAPTSAMVSISGQVLTAEGNGIFGAKVFLTSISGAVRQVSTNQFGYFRFDDIEVGQTYILSISSKRYQFSNPAQVMTIVEEMNDLNFVANN